MLQRPIAFPLDSASQDLVVDGLHVEWTVHARVPRMYRRPRGRLVLPLWFFPHGGWTRWWYLVLLYLLDAGAIFAGRVHDELRDSIAKPIECLATRVRAKAKGLGGWAAAEVRWEKGRVSEKGRFGCFKRGRLFLTSSLARTLPVVVVGESKW